MYQEPVVTEIEKTKRALYGCLDRIRRAGKHRVLTAEFEERLEEHLEAQRLSRVQFTESRQNDLERRLAAKIEECDQVQDRLHAVDRAYFEQSQRNGEQARQIEKLEELNRIAGEELIRVQGIARENLDDVRRAEKFSEKLRDAQAVIGHQEQLIVGQRLAIAELYMAKKAINIMAGGGRGVGTVSVGQIFGSNGNGSSRFGAGSGAYVPGGGAGGGTGR